MCKKYGYYLINIYFKTSQLTRPTDYFVQITLDAFYDRF